MGSNPAAIAWAKSFSELLDALQKYIKQYHTTGVTWNPKVSPLTFYFVPRIYIRATQLHPPSPRPPLPQLRLHPHLHLPTHLQPPKQLVLPPEVPQVQELS